jgi:hypothetical protein
MKNIKSLIFIPENVKFCEKKSVSDTSFLTLDERIKNDPVSREMLRAEMKIIGGSGRSRKIRGRTASAPITHAQQTPTIGGSEEVNQIREDTEYSGELEYIKNMTKTPLFISFGTLRNQSAGRLSRGAAMEDSICIEHFIYKKQLTEEQLNSPKLRSLYDRKQIMDVTYAQYQNEMSIIEDNKRKEAERVQRKREELEKDKEKRIGSTGGFRNSGSGGVGIEMGEVLGPVGGGALPSMENDVGIEINMSAAEIENHNPDVINSEMSSLISSMFTETEE